MGFWPMLHGYRWHRDKFDFTKLLVDIEKERNFPEMMGERGGLALLEIGPNFDKRNTSRRLLVVCSFFAVLKLRVDRLARRLLDWESQRGTTTSTRNATQDNSTVTDATSKQKFGFYSQRRCRSNCSRSLGTTQWMRRS